jgi:thioredoxin-related protein
MSQDQVVGSEVVGSCSIVTLDKLKETHKDGMFLLISQKGCGDCETMRSILGEVIKDKRPVIEAPIEDKECGTLAGQLGVGVTPTVVYYEKGEEKKRFIPDGKMTWDSMRGELRELVSETASLA